MDTSDLITAEVFAEMRGVRHAELVAGRFVRVGPSYPNQGRIAMAIGAALREIVSAAHLGTVMVGTGFTVARNPDTVRGPDVCFVRAGRRGFPPRLGFAQGAPELAVELVSPDNTLAALLAKGAEYLAAGAELVWIVDHEDRSVRVLRPGAAVVTLGALDVLDGGATVPGFRLSLAELFATE